MYNSQLQEIIISDFHIFLIIKFLNKINLYQRSDVFRSNTLLYISLSFHTIASTLIMIPNTIIKIGTEKRIDILYFWCINYHFNDQLLL